MTFSFKFDKDFWRRFKFYAFGLVVGMILVSIITKGKACQMPSTVKMEELQSQPIEYSTKAECYLNCYGLNHEDINEVMKTGSNKGKRELFTEGLPEFTVEGETKNKRSLSIIIRDSVNTSKIVSVADMNVMKDTCSCK